MDTAFNTNAIVYDNTPWRPGRDMELSDKEKSEDERKLKNVATKIMSNGVEVLVKGKNSEHKQDQRNLKLMHVTSMHHHHRHYASQTSPPKRSLLSSAVATVVNHQQMTALFPLQQLMKHNYIIKTCMTTYTYLTTVVHNERSAISTFETIVSVVTTESLTKDYASGMLADIKPTKTKFVEVKTLQPSATSQIYEGNVHQIEKRVDEEDFELIQPSEIVHVSCKTSCACSHTKTEGLKTRFPIDQSLHRPSNYNSVTTKYVVTRFDLRPTNTETHDKNTRYGPYEYESNSFLAPTDRVVEKYTEVVNDYSDEKDTNLNEKTELLTNEQAPPPSKINKNSNNKLPDTNKPTKPQKLNKNKQVVAELIKLGSLGIKRLTQLAPVIEKMTGGLIKRQESEINRSASTTTVKPEVNLTPYNVDKRVDTNIESKPSNFPIYIPVDEMETSETQNMFRNATLHQKLAWAAEHKQPKAHIVPPKMVHESPLVNGGIPISPGDVITANSDVIVGKPAVGGPLTLAASGIKLQNPVKPPPLDNIDSFASGNEEYVVKEKPPPHYEHSSVKVDDSFDLVPPEPPKIKQKPSRHIPRPVSHHHEQPHLPPHSQHPHSIHNNLLKTEHLKTTNSILGNHGRPAFIDYIPSFGKPNNNIHLKSQENKHTQTEHIHEEEIPDNSPSSSEIVHSKLTVNGDHISPSPPESLIKSFLVDIQPSKVANVIIPPGSTTALVFAGSSEPHKTGDYVDEQLPYPEPGYFGSFSIEAPQMTNVHNVPSSYSNQFLPRPNTKPVLESYMPKPHSFEEQNLRNEINKWIERPFQKLPPPTSNQETHFLVGPHITSYNPNIYRPNNGDFEKYKHKEMDAIDKEYEKFLSVPPPPPNRHYNQEHNYDNKGYSQRPVVHTKPVQDMKVFLNIQHPIPNLQNNEQPPQKVTSEVYYAAQVPNRNPVPNYSVHVPSSRPLYGSSYSNQRPNAPEPTKSADQSIVVVDVSSPNIANKSIVSNEVNYNDNTYTVTLNTATNVASNVGEGQVIGTSIPVSVGALPISNTVNNDIHLSSYVANIQNKVQQPAFYEDHSKQGSANKEHSHTVESTTQNLGQKVTQTNDSIYHPDYFSSINSQNTDMNTGVNIVSQNSSSTINSHANFPMMNEPNKQTRIPVSEYANDFKESDLKRPAKLIPNVPTNSHGWYSSIPFNENNINNIKVESSTRKVIPFLYDEYKESTPNFGQKITYVGKPPAEFLPKDKLQVLGIGRPFTTVGPHSTNTNRYHFNYIPSHFDNIKQPVYDIPVRENYDDTSTTPRTKLVYENSEEIYDGKEESDDERNDSEVSLESIKVPVVTSSNEDQNVSDITLLQDEVLELPKNQNDKENQVSQTETPFIQSNKTDLQSNNLKLINDNSPNTKPRPFTVDTMSSLDAQLHQPHWQINHMLENLTNISYEDFDLNTGEEISTVAAPKPLMTQKTPSKYADTPHRRKPYRPVFSIRPIKNDSTTISQVAVRDNANEQHVENSTTSKVTSSVSIEHNRTTPEIVDLSPPPPTLDYNFKPSTNDEMIMGMSPPPPRNPSIVKYTPRTPPPRTIPIRTPPAYRTKPSRTVTQRLPGQRPTRKPVNRDDISTYRPFYDPMKRPVFNRDQPSSQLLPPPREPVTKVFSPMTQIATPTMTPIISNVVFPTLVSSGWLTSSGVGFSSSFEFAPTSVVNFLDSPNSSILYNATDDYYPHKQKLESSSEYVDNSSTNKPVINEVSSQSYEDISEESITNSSSSGEGIEINVSLDNQSSQGESTMDKIKVVSLFNNKNRTRKPYPIRNIDKKPSSIIKLKPLYKPTLNIKPSKTLPQSEILYPARQNPSKYVPKPVTSKYPTVSSIIESSESSIDEDYIKNTDVLKESDIATLTQLESTDLVEHLHSSAASPSVDLTILIKPTHHSGNEIKISDDEVVPTKTEFRTTVVTLTKTLSEPQTTISSVGYINITHTLTVTHTKTSLVSQSEGAVTQTLVLTNTHTSTIVDVVTEVHTEVQPTTIIETVTKHIPVPQVEPTPVQEIPKVTTHIALDDISMSSEERENFIIKPHKPTSTENIQKVTDNETDNDTFFVVMNKSQNGGHVPPITNEVETSDYDVTRNEQVNSNGVAQVLFGEILLAGTPYLETPHAVNPTGAGYGKECQPDCKASRNERCQRIDGLMKCVCRPGFARMFPDRPCKPTYTYSVKLALSTQDSERLLYREELADNATKQYHELALATHEGINRMIMQSDLRDVYHGVHITGFQPVEMQADDETYQGVMNEFYVQLSDNAHESRLKEVIEKYLRTNNYSLGGTDVHAASDLMDKLDVSDFDECVSGQFHDCSEHAQCFNLRGTYTCSCLEGFADLSVNTLYPGRICSAEPVGCERCNYHGSCYSRDDQRVLCECFQWYSGSSCHINLKVVLISLVVLGAILCVILAACAVVSCHKRPAPPPRSIVTCIQAMPSLHQGAAASKQRADRRALINGADSGDASSVQNASLPYIPTKRGGSKKLVVCAPPAHDPPPIPAPAVCIPRARLHPTHADSRDNLTRKRSMEISTEEKLISYLESGATKTKEEMRRKHSMESSYSANRERSKQGALVSAGFKVSTTVRVDEMRERDDRDDASSINKADLEAELARLDCLRKTYSQEDISDWTDGERRLGELTLSEARSIGGTLPASTGRAASSTRLTHQDANTMAERDLGSTFLLPHVHLYKPDITSDVSEFDSL